jgi:hypothetical protein
MSSNQSHQPTIDHTSETAELEAVRLTEPPAREPEPARGRPSWTPDEGDFS